MRRLTSSSLNPPHWFWWCSETTGLPESNPRGLFSFLISFRILQDCPISPVVYSCGFHNKMLFWWIDSDADSKRGSLSCINGVVRTFDGTDHVSDTTATGIDIRFTCDFATGRELPETVATGGCEWGEMQILSEICPRDRWSQAQHDQDEGGENAPYVSSINNYIIYLDRVVAGNCGCCVITPSRPVSMACLRSKESLESLNPKPWIIELQHFLNPSVCTYLSSTDAASNPDQAGALKFPTYISPSGHMHVHAFKPCMHNSFRHEFMVI